MKMLEDIIGGPIFYQMSVFGMQISIVLFQLETVNIDVFQKCTSC